MYVMSDYRDVDEYCGANMVISHYKDLGNGWYQIHKNTWNKILSQFPNGCSVDLVREDNKYYLFSKSY